MMSVELSSTAEDYRSLGPRIFDAAPAICQRAFPSSLFKWIGAETQVADLVRFEQPAERVTA